MKGFKAKITQKVGPLPVWAWALIVVGLALAYRYYKARTDSSSNLAPAADPVEDSYYDGIYGGGVGGGAGGDFGGGGGASSGGGTSPAGSPDVFLDDPIEQVPPPTGGVSPAPFTPAPASKKATKAAGNRATLRNELKNKKLHPLPSLKVKGSGKHSGKTSPTVGHAAKPKVAKPKLTVVAHHPARTTSPAVGGQGQHPHAPQAPPHHAKPKHKKKKAA